MPTRRETAMHPNQTPERPAVRKLRELLEQRGMVKGIATGMAAGRAEGLAEGRAQGLAEGRAEGMVAGRAQGKLEGKIQSLLLIFSERGLPTSPEQVDRIGACTDFDEVSVWLRRALTAGSVAEVLAAPGSPGKRAARTGRARAKGSRPASG